MLSSISTSVNNSDSEEEFVALRCNDCCVNFTSKHYLYAHLFHHIRQPIIILERIQLPPLKITLKSKSDNSFEIVSSPQRQSPKLTNSDTEDKSPASNLAVIKEEIDSEDLPQSEHAQKPVVEHAQKPVVEDAQKPVVPPSPTQTPDQILADDDMILEEPDFAAVEELIRGATSPTASDSGFTTTSTTTTDGIPTGSSNSESNTSDYGSVPGAEPTPPPEPTPVEYPKIRIKTTGLLKEPLTITEITDDNPNGDPSYNQSSDSSNLWSNSNLEDPLKLPDNDDNNIMSLFNNNERAKDLGFHSSDSEFISLDRLEDRNRGAMQLYNPSNNQNQSTLDTLTGLPMQALAQQVSRLQSSSSSNGLHQQNVLINIQQFPSGPPQPSYQPPPMYPYPPQPMQPYQYQPSYRPPNPMYYPPGPPGYPPQHMPPPPQPQLTQLGQPPMNQQQMNQPPMSQPQMNHNQMPPSSQPQNMNQQMQQQPTPYRQPMPPRQPAPRPPQPGNRMPNPPRPPMAQRQPVSRPRAPMVRPRSATGMTAVRSVRPRMATPQNNIRPQNSPVKRTPEQSQQMQTKKKKFDLLTPDKDDDDCQVICMQPKNTDGGLPQIESVLGGTSETAESSIMHLSDSITLSVRNPPPKPAESPKKSDAKAVANILATRGITVTATAKPKETVKESPSKAASPIPTPINLNGAVSIIPAAKTNGNQKSGVTESLPTVDLTDDSPTPPASSPQKQRPGLPFRCDLCPAQYPNSVGLNKHRQTYHKTTSGMAELGIPVINLKTPGVMQKLSNLGICNYIPLPSQNTADGTFAVPIINSRNPANLSSIGSTTMISLGPIRSIPKPQNNVNKQLNSPQKS
ncbi:cell surface glycoprotein 1-like isoform X1 [Diabrotica virgifera virgifera]|uniref:C2H2-type domain-containing protein n=1 Tax=Diabrotica virgifera virgifera TaxID=50390 RepID=A0ABM5IRV6_DIAVI|nr:cell surface glycoprotein 1-like isoform X1 [Diabrotica virgifera virgifera]